MINKKRIAKNTILLYVRMLFSLIISLYISRIILRTLGVVDFGIYNVVGGIVTLFTIFTGPLSGSTRRFLTFEIGAENSQRLKQIFSTSLLIHLFFGIIVLLLTLVIGRWFVLNVLQIPSQRLGTALIVFYLSVLTTFFSIVQIPYRADVISHERMDIFSIISIFEVLTKLGAVLLLVKASIDKLVFYAILLAAIQIISFLSYYYICRKLFEEAKGLKSFNRGVCKELLCFIGWSLTGGITGVLNGQGINILLNVFFGPTVNAARGIAIQVQSVISNFCDNIQQAINPQITKTYASNDMESMHVLVVACSKYSFLFVLALSLPVLFHTDLILKLWLVEYPLHTEGFIRIILLISMIESMASPLIVSNHATGNIKKFQIIVESINTLSLPLAFIYLEFINSDNPIIVYCITLFVSFCAQVARIILVLPNIYMRFSAYLWRVVIPLVKVSSMTVVFYGAFVYLLNTFNSVLGIFLDSLFMLIILMTTSYYWALETNERLFVKSKICRLLLR